MKRRIVLSAGHSNVPGKDMGAEGNGYIEGNLTVELRDLIKEQLNSWGIPVSVDPNSNVTKDTVALFKKWFGANDIVVDIHFNASINPDANGTEVLIPDSPSAFESVLARKLLNALVAFNLRSRGVRHEGESARKKLFFFTIPSETVLIEVCFISNGRDMARYVTQKKAIAYSLATVLREVQTWQ